MKISYNWLKQFINVELPAEEAGELLTDLGLEIEGIESFSSVQGGLEGVVIGEVLTCGKHPNADRLSLTTVDIGTAEAVQIVCGAPNVAAGQKVAVATVGTVLFDAEGKPWTIKKGKIRGEVSMGMICAEDELGLGDSHDGIMVLDKDLIPGTPAAEIFEIEQDEIFEIGLTPNRADAMSHWGVARDLRAGLLQQEIQLELITPSTTNFKIGSRTLKMEVEVHDLDRAPRYCGVTISGLQVSDSPSWLQNRLKAIGLAPINNIVDITNYVLHELGQPLHAFDATKIKGNEVHVRTLPEGTKFVTLDGVERSLHQEDLMICDAEKPMCIAGVFGGEFSGVTEDTTSIFLESAYFDPISVRRTAKRHGLNTDASFRFERGIDPNITEYALMRAAILIMEIAGGEVTSEITDIYPRKIEDHQVVLNFENANRLIGQEIPRETIKQILTSLEIKVNNVTEAGIGMTIPAYRNDVRREADVIEEILRVFGYNNIDFSNKLNATIANQDPNDDHLVQQRISGQLIGQGFYEIMTNSLTASQHLELSPDFKEDQQIGLLNPLSQDLGVMRQSMLFGALESVGYNLNRRQQSVKFFEFGKTYHQLADKREEKKHLMILVAGKKNSPNWQSGQDDLDFFYLKGIVSALLERLGIKQYSEQSATEAIFSEGLDLKIKQGTVVRFGVIKKSVLKALDLEQEVIYADFDWDMILNVIGKGNIQFQAISKYPLVKRDFALLLDQQISFDDLSSAAYKTEHNLLKKVQLFDVYTGKNLPENKKSYALSFTLQDDRKTLTDKQIDKVMGKLQKTFEEQFGAVLR
ncbi:phenylalanine--tRNA ligase subunit beta [Aureitalea marina]|uniref:Phenylalanine--tRNA ligase beta subunit n=1 Tax=Aureitalea marina TaxID=930804 RepID=A0A2S7KN97_9FLAO|nr:phenylalanine--tRNA ligase subunit beta [Aureitalea marina]PQB04060.1 phenylalanine--tRNA ligase subunit beta [Aureitalea marina]